jgi:hypothetical protein
MSKILERGDFNLVAKNVVADEVALDEWLVFQRTGDSPEVDVCVFAPHINPGRAGKVWSEKKSRSGSIYSRQIRMPTFLKVRLSMGQIA